MGDNILNSPITEEEMLRVVKIFKSNKASGYDDIVNEHIKSTIHIFLPIFFKLFNIVLYYGLIPESWSILKSSLLHLIIHTICHLEQK
jgi:hypothetical protein